VGDIVNEDGARGGDRLQTARSVDRVPKNHPFALGAYIHGCPPGQDACPHLETRHSDLISKQCDRLSQPQRRSHCPLGIILSGDRRTPDRHHGITDELADSAAVALDQHPAVVEESAQQLADLLRVAVLREGGKPDQIREQHRHQPPLGDGHRPLRHRPGGGRE
jgi:hypothetical protein